MSATLRNGVTPSLDLRLVAYFVAVAEELHFGRAAERLHIAQPSLSQQIRRLETVLGVTLLERNSRNVQLTPAGQALLSQGRALLSQAQHVARTTLAAGAPVLNVGFYGSAGCRILPAALCEFADLRPSISVRVRELPLGAIKAVLDGEVNLAFTRLLPGQTELEVEVIDREPRMLALAAAHPLAGRGSISFGELADERFVINPATVDAADPPVRWLSEQRQHGLPGRVAARSGGVLEILTLVAAGIGVCVVPATVAEQHRRGDVVYVPLVDADPAVTSVAWRPGGLIPAAEAFIEVVRGVAESRREESLAA